MLCCPAELAQRKMCAGNYHFVSIALNIHKGGYTACSLEAHAGKIRAKRTFENEAISLASSDCTARRGSYVHRRAR